MRKATDFATYLSKFFIDYLPYERNSSKNTIRSYKDTFVQFVDYMEKIGSVRIEKISLDILSKDAVKSFLRYLNDKKQTSPSTHNSRLAAIHSFVRYLQYEDITRLSQWQDILSIKFIKSERTTINHLTPEGIKLLFEQPDIATFAGFRHLAILSLMYDAGTRVQELADLTVGAIRVDTTPCTIKIIGKGNKARVVPLSPQQAERIKDYIKVTRLDDSAKANKPLFFNSRGEKLTRAGITYILKNYADMARAVNPHLIPEKISCHSLRHSKAMHLLQSGVNIVIIRDFLGHSSIQTTAIYARIDSKTKREALEKTYVDLVPQKTSLREWEHNQDIREWLKRL